MSDVVKMYLAGWCPGLGSPLSAMTGVDEALQAGWPQGGAGVCCLGPSLSPPLPQNAFEAVPMMSTGGRVVTGSFVCAKTKTLPLNCHFQGARQLQR